ncbi:MAG: AAA family ATPase, partial [Lachnospiraceae bacterium]|nr:AAA family ATPase [Lachnospiraceae bacterium]
MRILRSPVIRDKIQSKLNNFDEYTMLDADGFAEYMGFTAGETKALCAKYDMSFDECRNWYDGYSVNGFEIYSPESVVKAMKKREYGGYWGKTSSYQVIAERIAQNFAGAKEDIIRMLAGEEIDVNVTSYLNTM